MITNSNSPNGLRQQVSSGPDLPIDTTPHPRGGWYDEAINDMLADQMYEEEMAAEAMADMMYEEEMQAELMAECMWDDDPGLYM